MQDTAEELHHTALQIVRGVSTMGSQLGATQWHPNDELTCAAWTLLGSCLSDAAPDALQQRLQKVDVHCLRFVSQLLERCVDKSPGNSRLWPDSLLWQYLLAAAKVTALFPLHQ